MGLTIHYEMSVPKRWSNETIRAKLEALRQSCMDLPVEEVSELREFQGKECEPGDDKDDPFRWAKIQSSRGLESPWQPGSRYRQYPSHMLTFSVWPARGCEEMNIGVCTFPEFVVPKREVTEEKTYADMLLNRPAWSLAVTNAREYPGAARVLKAFAKRWKLRRLRWSDDYIRSKETIVRDVSYRVCTCYGRYQSHRRGHAASWVLVELEDRMKEYVRWRFQGSVEEAKALLASNEFMADLNRLLWGEEHTIPGESGTWGSFCKTQYANDSEGGLPNFLRAHLSVCSISEKAGELGFKVKVHDEGDFWTKRDVKALAEEVGVWDQFIAGMFGVLKDATPEGMTSESAMSGRPDFEKLEAKAQTGDIGKLLGKIRDCLPRKVEVVVAIGRIGQTATGVGGGATNFGQTKNWESPPPPLSIYGSRSSGLFISSHCGPPMPPALSSWVRHGGGLLNSRYGSRHLASHFGNPL